MALNTQPSAVNHYTAHWNCRSSKLQSQRSLLAALTGTVLPDTFPLLSLPDFLCSLKMTVFTRLLPTYPELSSSGSPHFLALSDRLTSTPVFRRKSCILVSRSNRERGCAPGWWPWLLRRPLLHAPTTERRSGYPRALKHFRK